MDFLLRFNRLSGFDSQVSKFLFLFCCQLFVIIDDTLCNFILLQSKVLIPINNGKIKSGKTKAIILFRYKNVGKAETAQIL